MKINLPNELKQLNEIFLLHHTKLFVVGGFVRDELFNFHPTDIDLASALTNDELFSLLEHTPFRVELGSKKLGTTNIILGKIKFEHTTFRKEEYEKGGFHTPEKVEFITDIKEDAKRRDFTINSLYYDIQADAILDYFDGLKDLQKKQVRAILSPSLVFQSDGLRILRMIRIACELGFTIEENTFHMAKKMISQLKDIHKDRLWKEFLLTLSASEKYGMNNTNGVTLLIEIGAIPFIFKSSFLNNHNLHLSKLVHHLYYSEHIILQDKLILFVLDVALHFSQLEVEKKISVLVAKLLNMDTCGISIKQRKSVFNVIKAYEQSLKCKNNSICKKFLQDHYAVLPQLFELLNNEKDKNLYDRLKTNYAYMKQNHIPFTLRELAINGTVLVEELKEIEKKEIGKNLKKALKFCLENKNNNTKTKLIAYLKEEQRRKTI